MSSAINIMLVAAVITHVLSFCEAQENTAEKVVSEWKANVLLEIETQIRCLKQKCEFVDGNVEVWKYQIERHTLYDHFELIDSVLSENDSNSIILLVYSFYFGYDIEYLIPPSLIVMSTSDNKATRYSVKYDGDQALVKDEEFDILSYLLYYLRTKSGCGFDLIILTQFSKRINNNTVKIILNSEMDKFN